VVEDRQVNQPPIIGLIGGIGSGKSTVANILAGCGCVVSNADQLAHEELAHPEVVALLEDHWGPEVLNEQQQPDRGKIAAIVFQDDIERAWLERVLHPRVIARRNAQFADASADAPAYVIDAPLLVESGGAGECDHLIFVRTPRDKRLERVAQSRDWNEQEYGQRELAQMDLDEKEALAGFVINNDCDLEELRTRVEDVLTAIRNSP